MQNDRKKGFYWILHEEYVKFMVRNRNCEYCNGRGYFIYSDCGIDITEQTGEGYRGDLCPNCGEHQGEGEKERCEACLGTGKKKSLK